MSKKAITPIHSCLADGEVMDELRELTSDDSTKKIGDLPKAKAFGLPNRSVRAVIDGREAPSSGSGPSTRPYSEAIVMEFGRPALLVQNDTFATPTSRSWRARLTPHKARIDAAIRTVGRLELLDHEMNYVGTAWMVAEDVAVTNAHVADVFARRVGRSYRLRSNLVGKAIRAQIDFKEEYQTAASSEIAVSKVLFIEADSATRPDLAFLRLVGAGPLPAPIRLSSKPRSPGQLIGVIGYPAFDSRNDSSVMARVFDNIYDVKRFAPGTIMGVDAGSGHRFTHDCSTLGGNSGSEIIDLESGEAIGLHFGGSYRTQNFAVKAAAIESGLARLHVAVPVKKADSLGEVKSKKAKKKKSKGPSAADYAGRRGYRADFLGQEFAVPVPTSKSLPFAAVSGAASPNGKHVLDYMHFSLALHRTRRIAAFTASNVDGRGLLRIPRDTDIWNHDPRIDRKHVCGEELYSNNDLDRGHLVRRLDPVWGENAAIANEDTFHFTNCSPQHKTFNQSAALWQGLEEYVLDNADVHDLRVSVMAGPVFRGDDQVYRKVQIPKQYWKVLVMVREKPRRLSATGYIVSQADLLSNLEFVYGQYRTFQVAIAKIESLTALSFGALKQFDPLGSIEGPAVIRELDSLERLAL